MRARTGHLLKQQLGRALPQADVEDGRDEAPVQVLRPQEPLALPSARQ